jgi:hypothetical protein
MTKKQKKQTKNTFHFPLLRWLISTHLSLISSTEHTYPDKLPLSEFVIQYTGEEIFVKHRGLNQQSQRIYSRRSQALAAIKHNHKKKMI